MGDRLAKSHTLEREELLFSALVFFLEVFTEMMLNFFKEFKPSRKWIWDPGKLATPMVN